MLPKTLPSTCCVPPQTRVHPDLSTIGVGEHTRAQEAAHSKQLGNAPTSSRQRVTFSAAAELGLSSPSGLSCIEGTFFYLGRVLPCAYAIFEGGINPKYRQCPSKITVLHKNIVIPRKPWAQSASTLVWRVETDTKHTQTYKNNHELASHTHERTTPDPNQTRGAGCRFLYPSHSSDSTSPVVAISTKTGWVAGAIQRGGEGDL